MGAISARFVLFCQRSHTEKSMTGDCLNTILQFRMCFKKNIVSLINYSRKGKSNSPSLTDIFLIVKSSGVGGVLDKMYFGGKQHFGL